MKTQKLIKALEKVNIKTENQTRDRFTYKKYCAYGRKYRCEWYDEDGLATCTYILKTGEQDNLHTDYFPGWFAKTIKQIVNALSKD